MEVARSAGPTTGTSQVHLLGCPVRALERELSRQRDLIRELTLMRFADRHRLGDAGPSSLLALVEDIERHNRDLAVTTNAVRDQNLIDGAESVDLHYVLTSVAGPKMARVNRLYDEIDVLTRDDGHLLTLPPTAAMVRLRHWYFGEFVRQLGGAAPTPWPEYAG